MWTNMGCKSMVIKYFGVNGIKQYLSQTIKMANKLRNALKDIHQVVLPVETDLGLVCFRLNDNSKTIELENILLEKENYMIFTSKIVNDVIIRVALGGSLTQEKNIDNLIKIISNYINSN